MQHLHISNILLTFAELIKGKYIVLWCNWLAHKVLGLGVRVQVL